MSPPDVFVSVVMPVYNGERFLASALETLRTQTRQPDEVVIVDDGSTDGTPRLLAALDQPFRVLWQPNAGPAAARNHGLGATRGEVIAFLDVDDEWPPDKLEWQLAELADPSVDVVAGLVQVDPHPDDGLRIPDAVTEPHFRGNLGASLFRRRAFQVIGEFDEAMRFAEDLDWFTRAREGDVKVRWVHRVGLIHLRHRDNMTRGKDIRELGLFAVVKRSLDRRRRAGTARPLPPVIPTVARQDPGDVADRVPVSVVIPVYNGERFLAQAIQSVLDQTVKPLEIVVINDGSTDGSATVARGFNEVVRVEQAHEGLGAARNRGLDVARGELIAWLDADDVWAPEKLERQVAAIDANPELDMVICHTREFRGQATPDLTVDGDSASQPSSSRGHGQALSGPIPSATMVRRSAFERVGRFDTSWSGGADMDWLMRAKESGLRWSVLPYPGVWRRIHDDNMGRRERPSQSDFLHVIKSALDRRRSRDG